MNVLIVEDDSTDESIITTFLSRFGVESQCVKTMQEAVRMDAAAEWDLIIVDAGLPDADKYKAAFFADVARSSVVVVTGDVTQFDDMYTPSGLQVLSKHNMRETARAVISFLKERLQK